MVRTYVKKKNGPTYSIKDLNNAVSDVSNGNMKYREAAEHYGVPISVICSRISWRKVDVSKMGAGRPTELSLEVENCLEKCLVARAKIGYPCDKEELKQLVQQFICKNNMNSRFKDGMPGDDWYKAFMRRHPRLTLKKPEHLQKSRKDARDPFVVYDFFYKVSVTYEDKNIGDEAHKFIFNADETGYGNDPTRLRGIGEKGVALNRVSGGSGRDSTSVLACISAIGGFLPPLIIFKGAAVQPRWTSDDAYPGTGYAATSNGWMEEPCFFQWFSSMFIPHVTKLREDHNKPEQTAILFFDGHASHISIRLIEAAIANNIELIKLPSHLSDRLQPLDKCVFGPMKSNWERLLVNHGKTQMGKGVARLSRSQFSSLLGENWRQAMKPQNIISGFTETGLFPLNPQKMPESMFDPLDLARYRRRKEALKTHLQNATVQTEHIPVGLPPIGESINIMDAETSDSDDEILPLDLSTPCVDSSQQHTAVAGPSRVADFVEIFSKNMTNKCSKAATLSPAKGAGSRLKAHTYGEVLTASNVLERLKEVEAAKSAKRKKVDKHQPAKKIGKQTKKSTSLGVEENRNSSKKGVRKRTKKSEEEAEEESDSDEEDFEREIEEAWRNESDAAELEDYQQEMELDVFEEISYVDPSETNIIPNCYVTVDMLGGSRKMTHFSYVCKVDNILSDEVEVTGLKSVDAAKTKFVLRENDCFAVGRDQVKAILPAPSVEKEGRRIIYKFPGSICVKEK